MTTTEAIEAVEARLTSIEIHDAWGEKEKRANVMYAVQKYMAPEWDAVMDDFGSKKITAEQYAEKCFVLIDTFEALRLQMRTEKLLLSLRKGAA